MGEPYQGRRGTGGQTEAAMRYAKCGEPKVVLKVTCGCEATRLTAGERSDTETVTLRSERGDGKRAISTSPVAYSTCHIRPQNEALRMLSSSLAPCRFPRWRVESVCIHLFIFKQ